MSGIPASIATAVSDSLYGRPIRLNLTCNQESPVVEEEESCVLFKVDFTNFSPAFNVNMALYRFKGKVQQQPCIVVLGDVRSPAFARDQPCKDDLPNCGRA